MTGFLGLCGLFLLGKQYRDDTVLHAPPWQFPRLLCPRLTASRKATVFWKTQHAAAFGLPLNEEVFF